MLLKQTVLPNFVKSLVIASMTLVGTSAIAGHHEKAEEQIGDLKDMNTEAAQIKAEDLVDSADPARVDDAVTEEARKMMGDKTDEMSEKAMDAKPE